MQSQYKNKNILKLVYLGGVSEDRGIKELIKQFKKIDLDATLSIYAPENEYKKQLEKLSLIESLKQQNRLFFPKPVKEDKIIKTLENYDIGIIPYKPLSKNNKFCCPNKLSQYKKSGLAVISNNLPFVSTILKRSKGGMVVDFKTNNGLLKAIKKIKNRDNLKILKQNSKNFHRISFNWQKISKPFYKEILKLSKINKTRKALSFLKIKRICKKQQKLPKSLDLESNPELGGARKLTRSLLVLLFAKTIFFLQGKKKNNFRAKVIRKAIKNILSQDFSEKIRIYLNSLQQRKISSF